jgi:hypothetical protein
LLGFLGFDHVLPERVMLASLTPDSGLFRRGPDLASLGYDGFSAKSFQAETILEGLAGCLGCDKPRRQR